MLKKKNGDYSEQWDSLKELKIRFFWDIATIFPFAFAAAYVTAGVLNDYPIFMVCMVVLFAIPFLTAHRRLIQWPCPRCKKPFYYEDFIFYRHSPECRHCGLPQYASRDSGIRKDMATDELACLNCGSLIPEDESKCPHCAWNWDANSQA